MEVIETGCPFFRQSLYQSCPARLIKISYIELLRYQRFINILNFQEIELTIDNTSCLVYVYSGHDERNIIYNNEIHHSLYCKQCEWSIVPDVYISVPILYNNIDKLIQTHNQHDEFTINRY